MKFLYRTTDVKLINYVKPLPYLKDSNGDVLTQQMADIFFRLKRDDEMLGLVEAETISVVSQIDRFTNPRSTDTFDYLRIAEWEKKYSRHYTEQEWIEAIAEYPFVESVPKIFWLANHLRVGGSIKFPMTQAYNIFYNSWETVVGNGRIAPLRMFYRRLTIPVIRFKTQGCRKEMQWIKTFESLNDIEDYFGHTASINYRAFGGSLIPSVHFYDKEKYDTVKLSYQNKLAEYYKKNKSLGIDINKSLHYNVSKILDGLNALG